MTGRTCEPGARLFQLDNERAISWGDHRPVIDRANATGYDRRMASTLDKVALEWQHPGRQYVISTDPARLDLDVIHGVLRESYWSQGIPMEVVRRAIAGSLVFGVYAVGGSQVGFARVVTDKATFGYLADVFIIAAQRGRGLSKWLMSVIVEHPELQDLRRWLLATRDAHGLYAHFGFTPLQAPERFMERHDPDVYARTSLRR